MAPNASNKTSHEEQPLGKRKRVLAASLASTDNVDPLAIKRRKHEEANAAAAAQAAAQAQLTDNEIRDPSPDPFELNMQLLDTAGSDDENHQSDDDIEIMDIPEKTANLEEQDVDVKVEETDKEKLGESYIILES